MRNSQVKITDLKTKESPDNTYLYKMVGVILCPKTKIGGIINDMENTPVTFESGERIS